MLQNLCMSTDKCVWHDQEGSSEARRAGKVNGLCVVKCHVRNVALSLSASMTAACRAQGAWENLKK